MQVAPREFTKAEKRELKAHRLAAKEQLRNNVPVVPSAINGAIDCACVIHSDGYSWDYVDRLYNMLARNLSNGIRLHVYTEANRHVPEHMIKHVLEEWPNINGHRRSWWHKLQMFNPEHHRGPLLYFDLDVVITGNLDWILQKSLRYFWAPKDFKVLWKPQWTGLNSSIMWWDTEKFSWVWDNFKKEQLDAIRRKHVGDQEYLSQIIPPMQRQFLDQDRIKSWRWQALDGGFDFIKRKHITPGTGTKLESNTSVLIFHGKPKPGQTSDPIVRNYWV